MVKEELIQRIRTLRISHHICDDNYYTCPIADEEARRFKDDQDKDKCTCGASAHNAKIEKLIADLA